MALHELTAYELIVYWPPVGQGVPMYTTNDKMQHEIQGLLGAAPSLWPSCPLTPNRIFCSMNEQYTLPQLLTVKKVAPNFDHHQLSLRFPSHYPSFALCQRLSACKQFQE